MEQNHIRLKHWAEDDRPREKLMLKGRASLSDAELLAILIGSGSKSETAVDLAKRILQKSDNHLNQLGRLSISDLTEFHGIGKAKAITIVSALELGKRRRLSQALSRQKITGSADAYEVLQPHIGDLAHEEFWVIFLNTANLIVTVKCISKGGITGTLADVRMIFREAIAHQASAMILAHNHPSGSCNPSQADRVLTRKMTEAGKIMDIGVLDHLIVTEQHYYSFADDGMM